MSLFVFALVGIMMKYRFRYENGFDQFSRVTDSASSPKLYIESHILYIYLYEKHCM